MAEKEVKRTYKDGVFRSLFNNEEKLLELYNALTDRNYPEGTPVKNMPQTSKALPFAREAHSGQVRKGKDGIPYIYHPLLIACHALALGKDDDDMISTALLHDVCEDCGIAAGELPVGDTVKEAVALLTKDEISGEAQYLERIAGNKIATMVKLLDRCSNVSGMAGASKVKMVEYISETEEFIYPLLEKAKSEYPEYSDQIFLIRYHMMSVVESMKRGL